MFSTVSHDTYVEIEGSGKYIVALIDGTTLVIKGGAQYSFHLDIWDELKLKFPGKHILVRGGGFIRHDGKSIELYGTSTSFDTEPDRTLTAAILELSFPDHRILCDS